MRSSHQTLVFGFHLWECGNHFPRGKCALGGHILRRQGMSLSALRQGFKRYWILLKVTIMLGIVIFFFKENLPGRHSISVLQGQMGHPSWG